MGRRFGAETPPHHRRIAMTTMLAISFAIYAALAIPTLLGL